MGFPITLDESSVMAALQSVKELESRYSLSRAATLHGVRALGTKPKFFWCPLGPPLATLFRANQGSIMLAVFWVVNKKVVGHGGFFWR